MNREEFQKKLLELGALAEESGKRLSGTQVRAFFGDMALTEEQYELIFAYLASRQIVVEGYVPAKKGQKEEEAEKPKIPLTQEEQNFLRSYQKELEYLELLEEEAILELCREVEESGNDLAKARLTEQFLPEVLCLADAYRGRGLLLGDLVQEGNIGLMLALETLGMRAKGEDPKEYLRREICQAMEQAAVEHQTESRAGDLLAERLNVLRDQIEQLSNELERQISIEELSAYVDMPVEEIEELLKLAGEGPGEEKKGEA